MRSGPLVAALLVLLQARAELPAPTNPGGSEAVTEVTTYVIAAINVVLNWPALLKK